MFDNFAQMCEIFIELIFRCIRMKAVIYAGSGGRDGETMDLNFSTEDLAFREDVQAFIRSHLPEAVRQKLKRGIPANRQETIDWQRALNTRGWATPGWPAEHGGAGLTAVQKLILSDAILRAPGPEPLSFNSSMIGPILIQFGTPEQKSHFLPKIANLDIWFCQGFSEPGAGSDLASLRTRATREGGHYRVSGQKTWTSTAHDADWMFCLVRTDPDAPKRQQGITMLMIDMTSPGIDIRPIRSIDGHHHVNEVFFDDVLVPVENRVGEENEGWKCATFLLSTERAGLARLGRTQQRIDFAIELASDSDDGIHSLANPVFRNRVADLEARVRALEIMQFRIASNSCGDKPDPLSSILKLRGSELFQEATKLVMDVAGPMGLIVPGSEPIDFWGVEKQKVGAAVPYLTGRSVSIFGGTSEIQRNILARSVLGLL
jgi:alkylation response protein AidB-like acyl-CoA dehydrogenase